MKAIVKFRDVGRNKRSWESTIVPEPERIAREAKRGGLLMSSDVEAVFDSFMSGWIFVGGFRCVGSFVIEQ